VLRTNNALKFVKKDVSSFCAKNEIIHQISYSHTSQQNEIVEENTDTFWMLLEPC